MENNQRKKVSKETKEYIVKLVIEDGVKVSDIAYKFNFGKSTIHKWVKQYRAEKAASESGVRYITSKEVAKMQSDYEKKLRDLEEENAILKKAMHIFARNPE